MDSSDSDSYVGSATSVAATRDTGEAKVVEIVGRAFDPLPLDRAVVVETQHSGMLNAATLDLMELHSQAAELAAGAGAREQQMWSVAKGIQQNIDWLNVRVPALEEKFKKNVPIEYAQAESKVFEPRPQGGAD